MGRRFEWIFLQRRHTNGQQTHEKMPKGHRTSWYFYIFFTTEAWVLENLGGFGEEAQVTGIRPEDGIHDSWTLAPE